MKWVKTKIKNGLIPALATSIVSIFQPIFLWGNNASNVLYIHTALLPIVYYLAGGLLLFTIGWLLLRDSWKSALISILAVLLFSFYVFIENGLQKLFPFIRYWHAVSIVLVLWFIAAYLIRTKLSFASSQTLIKALAVGFSFLLLFNLFSIVPNAIKNSQEKENFQKISAPDDSTKKPNIYLFIFDEFASLDFIQKYYHYDNTPTAKALEDLGFDVSYSSRNEAINTLLITTNMMNLDYVVDYDVIKTDAQIAIEKRNNNRVFEILRQNGYNILGTGNPEFYGLPPLDENAGTAGVTMDGRTFSDLLIENTPLYPLASMQDINKSASYVLDSLAYTRNYDNFKDGGTFSICHLMLPHTPFYFDRNGKPNVATHINDWIDPQYYLNQYIFASKMMQETAAEIIENDPSAIIIMMSDHSARSTTIENYQGSYLFDYSDICESFIALYYQGQQPFDIEGMSAVNVMRMLMNELFAEKYDLLPYQQLTGYNQERIPKGEIPGTDWAYVDEK